jgi:hypothetical protein
MAGSLTISISSLSGLTIGGTRRSEASEILWMCENALRQMVASQLTSVSFNDRNGNSAGTISWTPVNSS